MTPAEFERAVAVTIGAQHWGEPHAIKRQRTALPWEAVRRIGTTIRVLDGRPHYATQDAALSAARGAIWDLREGLAIKLRDPRNRALRKVFGLPRDMEWLHNGETQTL